MTQPGNPLYTPGAILPRRILVLRVSQHRRPHGFHQGRGFIEILSLTCTFGLRSVSSVEKEKNKQFEQIKMRPVTRKPCSAFPSRLKIWHVQSLKPDWCLKLRLMNLEVLNYPCNEKERC